MMRSIRRLILRKLGGLKKLILILCVSALLIYLIRLLILSHTYTNAPSLTLVTALYDIGRENWQKYSRSFETYLKHFREILRLRINMVVFIEQSEEDFVTSNRRGMENSTHIEIVPFDELEYYRILHIISSKTFQQNNAMYENGHPEAVIPEYVVITNSKIDFLQRISKINPFGTTHFYWIDAGYAHVENVTVPDDGQMKPCNLLYATRQITLISLSDPEMNRTVYTENRSRLQKDEMDAAFVGGLFGGDKTAIQDLYQLHKKTFLSLLGENLVDDDQGVLLRCYFENPSLFNLLPGNWWDAFRLFN